MDNNYPDASILTQVAGGIPFAPTLEKIASPGIMLVGDAARQINPLSGGGIISGMIGGSIAGKMAGGAILSNNLDVIFNYQKKWHDRIGKKHEMLNRIKNCVYNLSDDKYNNIARSFEKLPPENRSLGNLARAAVINNPTLLIDVAKTFF